MPHHDEPNPHTDAGAQDWIETSNGYAKDLLELHAEHDPEYPIFLGLGDAETGTRSLSLDARSEMAAALKGISRDFSNAGSREIDPSVQTDLTLLSKDAEYQGRLLEIEERERIDYHDIAALVFHGIYPFLEEEAEEDRHGIALERLKRYAGKAGRCRPLATQGIDLLRAQLDGPLRGFPWRPNIQRDLRGARGLMNLLGVLFERRGLGGPAAPHLALLKGQIEGYGRFVRDNILNRCPESPPPRISSELYEAILCTQGMSDKKPSKIAEEGRVEFEEIREEMASLAEEVSKAHGNLPKADFRAVIRILKRNRMKPEAIADHYRDRIRELEGHLKGIVRVPGREIKILCQPGSPDSILAKPHYQPPKLMGNKEKAHGLLYLPTSDGKDGAQHSFDDIYFESATWTFAAHEARPGHDLQYGVLIEEGVSLARAFFGLKTENIEGWGLYAEDLMKPHMPTDGQLICLQMRLLRAARAFLDPELNLGKTTIAEARSILRSEIGLSEVAVEQELDRYFRYPSQAVSYLVGFKRLLELREHVKEHLQARFDQEKFHNFILKQGGLPPGELKRVTEERFFG
jgi:hypothetical protein